MEEEEEEEEECLDVQEAVVEALPMQLVDKSNQD